MTIAIDNLPRNSARVREHSTAVTDAWHTRAVVFAAACVMVGFHFGILSAIPMGVPLEWNVFMIFSVIALFVGHAEVGLSDMTTPLPVLLFAVLAPVGCFLGFTLALGNLIDTGKIGPDESVVLCITGHGLKTAEAVAAHCGAPRVIKPSLREFEELVSAELGSLATA